VASRTGFARGRLGQSGRPLTPSCPLSGHWPQSRVRKLAAGNRGGGPVKGSQPGKRYFVAGRRVKPDGLGLTDPPYSAAMRVLAGLAFEHPVYLRLKGAPSCDKEVRVGPDGVFVAVARSQISTVVERIVRTDVAVDTRISENHGRWVGPSQGWQVGFGLVFLDSQA